jgi:phosphotransferase system HPr (HPr) family protein
MGDYGVIELKRPTDSIIGTYSSKFIVESKALRVALKEASSHLEAIRLGHFLNRDDFFVAGNRRYAFIIIGASKEIAKKCQEEFLRQQFRALLPPGFQLYTYDEILSLFSGTFPPILQVLFVSHADAENSEITRQFRVLWKPGIHARPASMIASAALRFASEISLSCGGEKVNAKSIMGLMMLAVVAGSEVVVTAKGRDAKTAIATLDQLFRREFFMSESDRDHRSMRERMLVELGIISQAQLTAEREIEAKREETLRVRQREEMIRVAAYYQAENDHFRLDPQEYWQRGEAEVDERLRQRKQ